MPLHPLAEPERYSGRLLGLLRATVAFGLLFTSLLVFNGIQMISLALKLHSEDSFRKANRWIADTWWGWCDKWSEHVYRTRIDIGGDDIPTAENAIVLSNHQNMADITVLFRFARSKKRLGDLKWFVKDILKHVPGIGWGMRFLDCLFIKRDWTADKDYIHGVFEKILANRIPLWIISFTEGTRVTPKKIVGSQEYARKIGIKPLEHLLVPRTKGFVATVQGLGDHIEAVYDVTIGYVEGVPTIWQWVKGYVKEVHVFVRRFPITDLPKSEESLSNWLYKRYEEKDTLLAHYYREGHFPARSSD